VIALAGCGWLPPDSPTTPVAADPDAALVHPWKITGHVLGPRPRILESDAAGFHGRTVAITSTGFSSPWSGSCDQAGRQKTPRTLAEVTAELEVARDRPASLGLADPIIEYRLSCATATAPGLTLYLAGAHALTCWSGVCYLLSR
jgi:hypothetical protein